MNHEVGFIESEASYEGLLFYIFELVFFFTGRLHECV